MSRICYFKQHGATGLALAADLPTLSGVVDNKAAANDLTALEGVVDGKAAAADLTTLSGVVDGKAASVDVYTKKDVSTKTQADNLLNTKEGSFITMLPGIKNLKLQAGKIELMLADVFTFVVDDKRDATQVDTQINSKLAGILTPSQIVISNSVRNQL